MREGDIFERYRLVKRLGGGTFGEVYKVVFVAEGFSNYDPRTLKILTVPLKYQADLNGFEAEFKSEGSILERLRNNEHIVTFIDVVISRERQFGLAFEYFESENLAEFQARRFELTGKPLDLPTSLGIAKQVAEAIKFAHAREVLHGDVKPANILVRETGGTLKVKVIDFNVAEVLDFGAVTRSVRGTRNYSAPEVNGHDFYSFPVDIYSLGLILFEMLTGVAVWNIRGSLTTEHWESQVRKSYDLGQAHDLVWDCLQRSPSERPTASKLIELIDSVDSRTGETTRAPDRGYETTQPPPGTNPTKCSCGDLLAPGLVLCPKCMPRCWSTFHFDVSQLKRLLSVAPAQLMLKCSKPIGSRIASSPAIAEEHLVFGTNDGRVCCLDAVTLAEVWTLKTGRSVHSSPIIEDGYVFIASYNGSLYALRLADGGKVWERPVGGPVSGSPCVAGGVVVVGSRSGDLFLVGMDGKAEKPLQIGGPTKASVLPVNGSVYVASESGKFWRMDLPSRHLEMVHDFEEPMANAPSTDGEFLYLGGCGGKLYAFNCKDEKSEIVFQAEDWILEPICVAGHRLAFATLSGNVHLLDRTARQPVAHSVFKLGGPIRVGLVPVKDGALAFSGGSVYFIDFEECTKREVGRIDAPLLALPQYVGDTLYCCTADGWVRTFGGRDATR